MDETPFQKKQRLFTERTAIKGKLKEIGTKLGYGCDFLPEWNGQWVDLTGWKGSERVPGREIRIAYDQLRDKGVDEIVAEHQKDFDWLAGKFDEKI